MLTKGVILRNAGASQSYTDGWAGFSSVQQGFRSASRFCIIHGLLERITTSPDTSITFSYIFPSHILLFYFLRRCLFQKSFFRRPATSSPLFSQSQYHQKFRNSPCRPTRPRLLHYGMKWTLLCDLVASSNWVEFGLRSLLLSLPFSFASGLFIRQQRFA